MIANIIGNQKINQIVTEIFIQQVAFTNSLTLKPLWIFKKLFIDVCLLLEIFVKYK